MILPIQKSADNLSPSFYLSWPAFDTHSSHERKHFFSSFELMVSIKVVFITIVIEFFAGHLKFQNLRFFLQFLVGHMPLVSGWLRWQGLHHGAYRVHKECVMVCTGCTLPTLTTRYQRYRADQKLLEKT